MDYLTSILRIKVVSNALEELKQDVVFVGGATVPLYSDRKSIEFRPTNDVDILIELATHKEYAIVEEKLRKKGFENDIESRITCRFKLKGFIVDVMPTDEKVLGFSNKWYEEGFRNAIKYSIDSENTINIFSVPYFVATKLEAFKNRGNNDGRMSSDFEDIVFVFENRFTIWEEFALAPKSVKDYLKNEFSILLHNHLFEEWVDAHAGTGSPPATYYILENIENFVKG